MSQNLNSTPYDNGPSLGRAMADVHTLLSRGYSLQAPLALQVLERSLPLLQRSGNNARAISLLARYDQARQQTETVGRA